MVDEKEMRVPTVSDAYPAVTTSGLETHDDEIFVVVTQAFDGHGNQLVHEDGPQFDGFPGVTLYVETPTGAGELTLSPIHGDSRRDGYTDIEDGTVCTVYGAKGSPPLIADEPCVCGKGTYHRIYLSPSLDRGETVLICNVWGCHRSRIIDHSDLLSWVDH
jgi:hypothetical protein